MHQSLLLQINIFEWTKAGIHIDPERAYRQAGGGWVQGAEYYNMMPWTGSLGFKLNFDFKKEKYYENDKNKSNSCFDVTIPDDCLSGFE